MRDFILDVYLENYGRGIVILNPDKESKFKYLFSCLSTQIMFNSLNDSRILGIKLIKPLTKGDLYGLQE